MTELLSPTDLFGISDFDYDALEDLDFNSYGMPTFATSPALKTPPTPAAVQSSPSQPPHPISPQPRSRRASSVTVRRRSSVRPDEDLVSVTLEDLNGRKGSFEFPVDEALAVFAEWATVSPATQALLDGPLPVVSPVKALPEPQQALLTRQPHAQPIPYTSNYVLADNFDYNFDAPDLGLGPPFVYPTQAAVPFPTSLYAGPVPPMSQPDQNFTQRPATPRPHRPVRPRAQRPSNSPARKSIAREAVGGRPPLPDSLASFASPNEPVNHGRVPDKRGTKDTTVANDFYYSISALPDLELPQCGMTVAYTGIEFEPDVRFTGIEFLEYLVRARQRPNRHPILRIQMQPAQYNHRYKRAGASFKCRFSSCPDKRNTITKGSVRVCISEFEDEHGDWINPFHNAGYVHLDCLEKQVNFVELYHSKTVTIVPETRSLQHEPPATTNMRTNNPMALNDVERTVATAWFDEMSERWEAFQALYPDPVVRPNFDLSREDMLVGRLTKAHIEHNKPLKRVQELRKRRAGGRITANLSESIGDVSKQAALQKEMKAQPPPKRKAAEQESSSGTRPKKQATEHESLSGTRPKRRRVTPPPHMATPRVVEEPLPVSSIMHAQGDVYMPQFQADYYPPFEYDGLPAVPEAVYVPTHHLARPMPQPQFINFAATRTSPRRKVMGTPRHAQRRPSPIKITLSPSRRQSSAGFVTVTRGSSADSRRSSARLAARRTSRTSSASLADIGRALVQEAEGNGAREDGEMSPVSDYGSLFGDEPRIEEIE